MPLKISIVMPSFNQGDYIEQAICSVLDQDYADKELLVLDGGSSDQSVEILKKYSKHLTYWRSAKDGGQCDAINQGLRRSNGEIWAYLNSDDFYASGVFSKVAEIFESRLKPLWVTGYGSYVSESGCFVEELIPTPFQSLEQTLVRWMGPRAVAIQVSNFMRRSVLDDYGYFDESLHYSMDFDYGLRLLADQVVPVVLPEVIANARLHSRSKTVSQGSKGAFLREDFLIIERFLHRLELESRKRVESQIREQKYWLELAQMQEASLFGDKNILGSLSNVASLDLTFLFRRSTIGSLRRALFS